MIKCEELKIDDSEIKKSIISNFNILSVDFFDEY